MKRRTFFNTIVAAAVGAGVSGTVTGQPEPDLEGEPVEGVRIHSFEQDGTVVDHLAAADVDVDELEDVDPDAPVYGHTEQFGSSQTPATTWPTRRRGTTTTPRRPGISTTTTRTTTAPATGCSTGSTDRPGAGNTAPEDASTETNRVSDTGGCTYVKTRIENPGGAGLSPQIDSQT